jgi:molybdenum cofactor cytidylyltransferase
MIAAIVLAAGSSTRLGRPKQLLPLGDRAVIEHVVDRVLAANIDRVVVVVGHAADAISAVLGDRPVEIVFNPEYRAGQSSSLRVGLELVSSFGHHVSDLEILRQAQDDMGSQGDMGAQVEMDGAAEDAEAVIILLGDQPGIATESVDRLVERWNRDRPPIVMTSYGGKRSHPVLFARDLFPELLAIEGDRGARDVIHRHRDRVVEIDSGEPDLPADIDTEEAYRAMLATWKTQP